MSNQIISKLFSKVTIKLVTKLVNEVKAYGTITCSYCYENSRDNYYIHFSNGSVLNFDESRMCDKVFRILKFELGYAQNFNFSSDEHDGIVQAASLGLNPFKCTIL